LASLLDGLPLLLRRAGDKGGVTPTLQKHAASMLFKHASVSKSRINCVPETLALDIPDANFRWSGGSSPMKDRGEARLAVRKNFFFCLLHRLHFFGRFAALIALTISIASLLIAW
jgi:hypothetical protein